MIKELEYISHEENSFAGKFLHFNFIGNKSKEGKWSINIYERKALVFFKNVPDGEDIYLILKRELSKRVFQYLCDNVFNETSYVYDLLKKSAKNIEIFDNYFNTLIE